MCVSFNGIYRGIENANEQCFENICKINEGNCCSERCSRAAKAVFSGIMLVFVVPSYKVCAWIYNYRMQTKLNVLKELSLESLKKIDDLFIQFLIKNREFKQTMYVDQLPTIELDFSHWS